MHVEVAVSKIAKYACGECGDSAELVERPQGGISALIADGQGSGRSAKMISKLVVSKASALIADGTRDGAVARATHDYLFAMRGGKVSATLTMLSADLTSRTIVISRNSHCPVLIKQGSQVEILDTPVEPIGFHHYMKPVIYEIALQEETLLATFTDGILHSGRRYGQNLKLQQAVKLLQDATPEQSGVLAEQILALALELDRQRPTDDMTVLVLGVHGKSDCEISRMRLSCPV